MTNEDINGAINYLKSYRKLDENLHNMSPKDSVAYFATDKCLKYWDMAIKALEQEPTDDATLKDIFCMGCEYKEQVPKTGHWKPHLIEGKYESIDEDVCSVCEMQIEQNHGEPWSYCPNCGAKMVEPQESEE